MSPCLGFRSFMRRKNNAGRTSYEVKRTSKSVLRLRCVERTDLGVDGKSGEYTVKLIVFDFDECLTLVTLMSEDGQYTSEQSLWAREVNFETPWVPGSRIEKLQKLLDDLRVGKHGEKRVLAILTRNGNANGVTAVINLMKTADLDHYFAAVWALPYKPGRSCGAYRHQGKWIPFDPPLRRLTVDHKADVVQHVVNYPQEWFPQMAANCEEVKVLASGLKLVEVVMVDDQRANFQSPSGAQILRYCKVARFDASYRDFGVLRDMGGIGAHDDFDYDMLKRFVEDPWMCKETYQVRCQERDFEGHELHSPISVIIFDFDETLTMATFMPTDKGFAKGTGWKPNRKDEEWSEAELLDYNFESPYISGNRVSKLRKMLKALSVGSNGDKRTLAILTKNDMGVFAVLNLLSLAGLAEFFSTIWTLPLESRGDIPNGVFRSVTGEWKSFEPPMGKVYCHKADVIHHMVANPEEWFPQLGTERHRGTPEAMHCFERLNLASVALVDDERANFRSDHNTQAKVLRYCKVARYDEVYRDCRLLNQMGGIGAHSDTDYETLQAFVERPWEYPYESSMRVTGSEPCEAIGDIPSGKHEHNHSRPTSTRAQQPPPSPQPALITSISHVSLCRDDTSHNYEPSRNPRVRVHAKTPSQPGSPTSPSSPRIGLEPEETQALSL